MPGCPRCQRHDTNATGFQFQTRAGPVTRCLGCALRYPPLLRRSVGVALVVGSILVAVNHGDTLLAGTWSCSLLWKLPLTYLVPFLVATWGALTSSRRLNPSR